MKKFKLFSAIMDKLRGERDTNPDELDYSLRIGDVVWFTHKSIPKDDRDWIEAEILDLNWACRAVANKPK